MARILIALVLLLVTMTVGRWSVAQSPAPATTGDTVEQLARWSDDATFLVITADLAAADPSLLLTEFAAELRAQQGTAGGNNRVPAEMVTMAEQLAGSVKAWRSDFLAAGGRELWGIVSLSDITSGMGGPSKPFMLVAPLADAGKAAALTKVIERLPDVGGKVQQEGDFLVAGNLNRVGPAAADGGEPSATPRLPLAKATRAVELRGALAQAGPGSVKFAFVPAAYIRKAFEEMAPTLPPQLGEEPMTTLTQGVQSLTGALSFPPEAKLGMVAKSASPAAAQKFAAFLEARLNAFAADKNKAGALPELAKILGAFKPTVAGDQLTWSMDQAALRTTMGQLVPAMMMARSQAQSNQVGSQIRQVLMGCWIHSSQNKDQWPDDLTALITSGILTEEFREILPKLVHRKPSAENFRNRPAETPALYEKYTTWPSGGIWVGFVDGHVSKVSNEAEFKALLNPTLPAPAGR